MKNPENFLKTLCLKAAIVSKWMMICLLLSLAACNRNAVVLDYTNAKDEVPQLGNLVFRFNKPLVNDSMLNKWDSTAFLRFEPAIRGRFRWDNQDELIFSPSEPLHPATSYKVFFNQELLAYSPYDKVGDADDIHFHTADLELKNANIWWVLQDEATKTALPQLDLYFNYQVDPQALKEKLKINVDGKAEAFTIQTVSADNVIAVRLLNVKAEDKDYDVKILLDKGLVPVNGHTGTAEISELKSYIPSPFVLNINEIISEHDGITGSIIVKTSQQIIESDISSFIKLDPSIKFSVEPSEDGFIIRSAQFDMERSYGLTLLKGLRGKIGGVLRDDRQEPLAFGKLEPSIRFTDSKAVYLSSQGNRNIEVKLTNVPRIKLVISKIYESNLLMANRYGYYPQETTSQGSEGEYYDYGNDITPGDVIYEQEIDTRSLPKYGASRLFNFNIADRLPEFKGIYHILLRSTDSYWVRDSRFVSLSDIGLIAKEGLEKMYVFVNSIKTTTAAEGVNIVVYGSNNQVLGLGATNAEGVAEIDNIRKDFAGFKPAMIIARSASDFNFMTFNNTRVNTSRFETGGKRMNKTGLDAFIYAERDIYRPGERVSFSVIIRDALWKIPGEIPVKLKFLFPNGKEFKSFRKNLNEQGSLEGNIDIAASAITGSYLLEVYSSNDILLGTKAFMIEEFVPDRIKVTASLDPAWLKPGERATLKVNAVNFFGPPAAGRNYETEIQLKQRMFSAKKFPDYDFSLANQNSFFDKVVNQGKTDEKGNLQELYQVPDTYKNMGLLQASFYATVFDETGRPVSRNVVADIYTQSVFAGVRDDGYGYYPLNQLVKFPLIAVDKDGALAKGAQLEVKVIKHEYKTVLSKVGGYFNYQSQKQDKLVNSGSVTINAENIGYSFTPRSPGEYEIRVALPGANNYVSRSFYSYGYWGGDNNSFEVDKEGNINIESDKTIYQAGETMKLLFTTPFSGKMLVTMETDKLISYQYVSVEKRSASIDLKLSKDHLPNVYITATLIKPHEVADIPLTVAHGFQSIKIEEKSRRLAVEIISKKAVRSNTRQKIRVKSEPGSYITLAAVDNGVLQVSGFTTPDPFNYFYAPRALGVNAFDIYPLLFPELRPTLSSTGGDGEMDMSKRVNPIQGKRVKIVSFWSGITRSSSSGEAEFEVDLPAFSGEIRLMAVAYKNERMGSAESAMKVADPLVLSTSLPRFLSPGDTAIIPVTVTNTTAKASSANVSLQLQGPLKAMGANAQMLNIAANAEGRVIFKVVSDQATGLGKLRIEAAAMGERFINETEISVRPSAGLLKASGSGVMNGGSSEKINMAGSGFINGTADYQLMVSRSPVMELASQLDFLIQYPYGCTEQMVSAAFPQLYFSDLSDMVGNGNPSKTSAVSNVQEAIRKIKMRQLYNGALMLWDNEGTEHWWSTIYAAHFLLEAKKSGYDVEKSLLDPILAYINNRLRNRETILYYYNRDQQKKIAPKEVAYSLYVLALAQRSNISIMNYYKANPSLLSLDSRYLLSAAYALSGDKQKFKELLPASFSGEQSVPQSGGSFYSPLRDEAIALNVLMEVDPGNSQIPVMAKHVGNMLKQGNSFNTQESVFSFLALGKLAKAAAKATVTGEVKVNGKLIAKVGDNILKLSAKQLGASMAEISTKGTGKLYYWWQSEGISKDGSYKEEDSYLKVRKKFFDRFGNVINGFNFRQNDLIIVQISLEKAYAGSIENIVITDMLPAGFEIENPRIKEIPGMDWVKDASSPLQIDIRDDRINLFADLFSAKQTYYYAVRAVSPGVYHMGPVSADAMYQAEYHSYHGAGLIRVAE